MGTISMVAAAAAAATFACRSPGMSGPRWTSADASNVSAVLGASIWGTSIGGTSNLVAFDRRGAGPGECLSSRLFPNWRVYKLCPGGGGFCAAHLGQNTVGGFDEV